MKTKFIPMLAGAIALTLAAVPFAVKAQSTDPSTPPATTQPQGHKGHHHHSFIGLAKKAGITLSPDQITTIKTNNQNAWAQIKAVFTPEQIAAIQAAKGTGQRPNLELTSDQKAQIKQIRQQTYTANVGVLTSEQQQTLTTFKAQWKANHNQNGQGTTTTTTTTPQ